MSRSNDVFQILVTSGNQSPLAADQPIDALLPGQVGVFNSNTGLAIDGSAVVKDFFLAVGLDRDGDTVTDDIRESAGQMIQRVNTRFYSFRPHTAGQPMITEVSNFTADCDTDYAIRVEFRNQEIYRRQGHNQFTKTYAVRTACCEGCEGCPSGDVIELVSLLVNEMNLEELGLMSAEAYATEALTIVTHGTSADYAIGDTVPEAEFAALQAYNVANPDTPVAIGLRMTTNELAVQKFCNVNLKYYNPRQTVIVTSLVDGFGCSGDVVVAQEAAMEEGAGYDIKQKEYHAGGWNGNPGPYRLLQSTGTSKNIEYFAQDNVNYDQLSLTYDIQTIAGWGEHYNNLNTTIAIPSADTTTRDEVIAILDGLLIPLGFDALADDAALADTDDAVVEPTEAIDDVDGDGIA